MKLLHTSDWHLGMSVGTGNYEECQRFFFEQLYALIQKEQVSAVLCAGDIYDSSVTTADAIALYNDVVTTLCARLGVKLIVIAGNHDSAPRLSACRELLKSAGLYVTGRLEAEIQPILLDGGKVAVYPLPFFGRDEVAALYPGEKAAIRSQEDAMQLVCDRIREGMDSSRRNILLSHSFIVNAQLSESDRAARVGLATAVSREVFHGFDYVALGHIHKPQILSPHIRYSGSPLPYSFGKEEGQEKGVVLLDTETMEQIFVSIPLLRQRQTVEGTYDEIIARTDLSSSYLRLKINDRYPGLELIAELRERFPYLLEVYGKSLSESGELSALSVEELEKMDESDIMEKFMGENYGYTPSESQKALFQDVLSWINQEDTLG